MTDDGIRFSVFAPLVHQVAVQGSWNDFQSVPMAQATDGTWWISFPLSDGLYTYRFEIVQEEGKEAVFTPNPTSICFKPDDLEYSLIEIVNGQPVYFLYQWQHDNVDLVPNEKLIIYEMHLSDFCGHPDDEGANTFEHVMRKLDYLVELGINAVELMPITQSAPGDNWGYSQYSLYAVDSMLGTPGELAHLVDECHKRGIRVIHDGVYNHMYEDAPLTRIDYDYWFYENNPDEPEMQFGPKLNYEFYDGNLGLYPAREHTLGAIHRWIGTFHMDGIRFDAARALKPEDVIHWFNDEAHKRSGFKPFFTIAESIPQNPAITGPNGPMDAAWHDNFYRQLNCTVLGIPWEGCEPFNTTELLRVMNAKTDEFASNYNTVRYLNNHDQERTIYSLGKEAHIFDEAAFRRNKLGASLFLTAPGIPMLWMGEEFGQANPRGENTEKRPLNWALLDQEPNHDLWQHYQRLIAFRLESGALCSDNFESLADIPEHAIIAYKRWDDDGNVVLVIANLKDEEVDSLEITLKDIDSACWRDLLSDTEITTQAQQLNVTLHKSQVMICVTC